MFTKAILKIWDPIHLPTCGWYLDCPLKRPPSSEVSLCESLEPALKKSIPKVKTSIPVDVVVDLATFLEDLEA